MENFKKVFAVCSVFALGFACFACKSDGGGNSSAAAASGSISAMESLSEEVNFPAEMMQAQGEFIPASVVKEFVTEYEAEGQSGKDVCTFYSDGTFQCADNDVVYAKGTYEGDPLQDGKIVATLTESLDSDEGKLVDVSEQNVKMNFFVKDGKLTATGEEVE